MKNEIKKKKSNAKRRHKRRVKKLIWSLVIIAVLGVAGFLCRDYILAPETEPVSGNEVQFHFIDVGQGDAILIRTAAGDVLIDAGDNAGEEALEDYLNKYRVDDLEYAVFTHPDRDHIGGGEVVLELCEVKRVLRPLHDSDSATYETLDGLIRAEGAEDIRADVGDTFTVGEVKFTILAPIGNYKDNNNNSVVLRMDYGETSVLFTGDAEADSEADMLERYGVRAGGMLDCDILKVGHHGSDSSSTADFLRAVTPELAVICCGEGNSYGHPHGEITDRLEDMDIGILRTDKEGSIVFTTTGGEPETMAA